MTIATSTSDEAAGSSGTLSVDAVRRLLSEWVKARSSETASAALARPWSESLSNTSAFDEIGGAMLAVELPRRLALLANWSRELGDARVAPAAGSPLAGWLASAAALASCWPPTNMAEWRRVMLDLSATGNRVVRGCVATTLADCLEASGLPQPRKVALIELLRRERLATPAWPLPPGASRSWSDADYFFAHRNRAAWERLRESVNGVGGVATELAKLQRLDRLREQPTDPLAKATRDTIDAVAELGKLIELGKTGTPVTTEQWRSKFEPCVEAATRCQSELPRRSPPHAARLAQQIDGLRGDADLLSVGLNCEFRATQTREGEAGDCAGALHSEAETSSAGGAAGGLLENGPLARACAALEAARDERASLVARRLQRWREWAPRGRASGAVEEAAAAREKPSRAVIDAAPGAYSGVRGAGGETGEGGEVEAPQGLDLERQLLACLTHLDDISAERGCPAWVEPARAAVRGEVERRGAFVVLDRQLLGLKLTSVIKLAEGCGTVRAARPAPGHIAQVIRPGYAFPATSGVGEVLIRARVLIAEAEGG